jgi:hypothetical protein
MDVQDRSGGVPISPWCLCTTVSERALEALLEGGDAGCYRDTHPWFAARELYEAERTAGRELAIFFAAGTPLLLSHWALLQGIDVLTLHRGAHESRCEFVGLRPVHALWTSLDSLALKPGDDQLRREAVEPLPRLRHALDARRAHPYAICETPAFVFVEAGGRGAGSGERA